MMNIDSWKLVTVAGSQVYYVLVDDHGKTRAQGRRNLCEAVKQSYRFNDDTMQRNERLAFYGVMDHKTPARKASTATP